MRPSTSTAPLPDATVEPAPLRAIRAKYLSLPMSVATPHSMGRPTAAATPALGTVRLRSLRRIAARAAFIGLLNQAIDDTSVVGPDIAAAADLDVAQVVKMRAGLLPMPGEVLLLLPRATRHRLLALIDAHTEQRG